MRLIDVDALRADYGMAEDCKDCKTGYRSCEYDRIYSKMDFCGWLDDAPTVDAVPVVRCKNCEHHESYGAFMYCERHSMTVSADYYCGDGKDGDHHEG